MSVPDAATDPLFVALASALASIEAGTIAEAEVESRQIRDGDNETILTITVRRTVQPLVGPGEP